MREMRHRRARRKKKIIWSIILGIVLLLVLAVVFFFPLNNTVRNITGNDTPTDQVVKSQLVKRVEAEKNGDASHDKKITEAAQALEATKMSTVMSAADNQKQAAQLIQDSSSLSKTQSQQTAKELFTNDKYATLRSDIASGDWYSAYNEYKKLSDDGAITALKNNLNQ